MRFEKEVDMYAPVLALFDQPIVLAEVPFFDASIDLLLGDANFENLIAIEVKNSGNKTLIKQALARQLCAQQVYVATPTGPANYLLRQHAPIFTEGTAVGVIAVGKTAKIIAEPGGSGVFRPTYGGWMKRPLQEARVRGVVDLPVSEYGRIEAGGPFLLRDG
jgi:hypothetical protein